MLNSLRRIVLLAATILFLSWLVVNYGRITADEDGFIRFFLGGLFAVLILFRSARRPRGVLDDEPESRPKAGTARYRRAWVALGVAGMLLSLGGIIFRVHQFEWLGLILILYACLRWALPERCGRDVLLALFLLYWIHPLPGQLFGKFQLAMQWVSVKGAEWALQAANVRVWADGFILRMGLRTFGVPESCSGMQTAVTVLLCMLGVGMLFRFRWYETVAFMFLGVLQVLALNIIRITLMVIWSARMPVEWSQTFLHDTLGIFLLIAMLIVQGEASWWKMWSGTRRRHREGIALGELERPERASPLPRFWRVARRWGVAVALLALVMLGLAFAVYKKRPYHRAMMISEVVDGLIESDPESAQKGVDAALALNPGDRSLLVKKVRVLVLRGKFEEAYPILDELTEPLNVFEAVLKSRVLVALRRPNEAAEIVEALPESARLLPGVALIRAEYAALLDQPKVVSENLLVAARSHLTIDRIRALYPYLAMREQWAVIVESDSDQLYHAFVPALVAVHACLRMNNIPAAARVLRNAVRQWPRDSRLLPGLSAVALARPGTEWEEHFAENLRANLPLLNADQLGGLIDDCFRMARPDLAWQVYLHLQRLDPEDPSLLLAPAQYGSSWFTFRRHRVGLKSEAQTATIDLRPFCAQSMVSPLFQSVWGNVPVLKDMLDPRQEAVRKGYLEASIEEYARREADGRLTRRMQMSYPIALAMMGRYDEAHIRLDEIETAYPDRRDQAIFQHAVFYDEQARWQDSYEALVRYRKVSMMPNLLAELMTVNALMNLDLGLGAMETVRRARKVFPGSPQLDLAEASIWDAFGFKEQALFVIERSEVAQKSRISVQLLHDTSRMQEARKMSAALGIRYMTDGLVERQPLLAPPAELAIAKRWPEPLSDDGVDQEAERYQVQRGEAGSPYIRDLSAACAAWYRGQGEGELSNPVRWKAMGRNAIEQAAALNRLTTFLAWRKEYDVAEAVAREAITLLPDAAVLRRILIALTDGDPNVVAEARATCPDDPEIWLAELVVHIRDAKAAGKADKAAVGAWAKTFVEEAVAAKRFASGTMVRAGEFLLKQEVTDAAVTAARDAVARCRGLLSAYVLGLRCAVEIGDEKWALSCALNGVDNALDPTPFYKTIVEIKSLGRNSDADLVTALEYLRERFPDETQWAEQLAYIYFQKRDVGRALSVLGPAMAADLGSVRLQSVILAAEAARLHGDLPRAINILENAYAMYPDQLSVLNNLVYCLAQEPAHLPRAKELLPALLKMGEQSFAVLDTAAVVYFRSGQLDLANEYMSRALRRVDEKSYGVSETRLNAAEILFRMGEYEKARENLEAIRRYSDRSHEVEMGVRRLRERVEQQILGR